MAEALRFVEFAWAGADGKWTPELTLRNWTRTELQYMLRLYRSGQTKYIPPIAIQAIELALAKGLVE
jgi:hypothetical protein